MMVEETKSILTSSSSLLPLRDESQLFVFFYHLPSFFFFFLLRLYVSVCEKERERKRLLHVKKKKKESIRFASSTEIDEHRCRRVPVELLTIIIIFLSLTLPFDGWWRPLIVLLLFSPFSSMCVRARCCCRQKSVTLHSIYAANRRNRHTHTRLARLRIELYSLQTYRNLFLSSSSLFIVSFSFVFSFFLRSYMCV